MSVSPSFFVISASWQLHDFQYSYYGWLTCSFPKTLGGKVMTDWQKTGCVLCAQNCGLEVQVSDNRLVRVRPDKDNPRSKGYACRKGMNIANYQHHAERLTVPLKKTADGFVPISWDQAFREIGGKLKSITAEHGPKSFAYMGGGGQGCHFEAAFGLALLRALGSRYHYNALAQELTGFFWVSGRMLGRQNRFPIPYEDNADMLLAVGWNGMVSHQMVRAPLVLKEFATNPDKKLVVVDPRRSETARIADLHLPLSPGTDALFWRAVISLLLTRNLLREEQIRQSCTGFDEIRPWFTGFDTDSALAVCGLEPRDVDLLVTDLASRNWCMHFDLGIHMNRHSTLAAYLLMLLAALCGRLCVPGGQVIPGSLMPIG
jgi:anaerobic selenocysteine-containing dehydrogenase